MWMQAQLQHNIKDPGPAMLRMTLYFQHALYEWGEKVVGLTTAGLSETGSGSVY